ncbi:MAG: helix-turn-helix domain-containing protein [Clostridium butyricum]|nr:helix-turn-helix domain-containing protein [Clostridium butyricum]
MSNNLWIDWNHMPLVSVADKMYSKFPFIHADRIVDFHVLIYVLKGCISVVEDNHEYVIKESNLFFLKAGVHHYGIHKTAPNTSWIYIHFYLDEPNKNLTEFKPYTSHIQEQEFSRNSYKYKMKIPKFLKLNSSNSIENKLFRLVEIFHSSNPLRGAYMTPLLHEILINCCSEEIKENDYNYDEKIYKIIQYLQTHTHEQFNSDDLSNTLYLSYKHLAKIFKEATGKTLLEYHTAIRMNESARMLRETSYSIKYISLHMGYSEAFYFSNVFKKIIGISPKAYRKQFINHNFTNNSQDI